MVEIVGGKNTITRIDHVLMAISVDSKDQTEGVCAVQVNGMWIPLIAADEKREHFVREGAKMLAQNGAMVKLIRLTNREEVETLGSAARQ